MNPQIITLDVREDIHAGREPFPKIMQAAADLRTDETLRLIAPFEPVPLCELLGRQGFQHTAHIISACDWEVLFTRQPGGKGTEGQPTTTQVGGGHAAGRPPEVIELDARGLEPPQPLVKILEALGALPGPAELRAHTDRRPMHLYAQLEMRGFAGESQEQSDGSFITHIRHR